MLALSDVDRRFEPRSSDVDRRFEPRFSDVDRRFDPRSSQTKNYKIGICCFSNKHVSLIKDEVLLTVGCPIFPPFYIDSQISVHRKF